MGRQYFAFLLFAIQVNKMTSRRSAEIARVLPCHQFAHRGIARTVVVGVARICGIVNSHIFLTSIRKL